MIVLVVYCCITNYHKHRGSKQHTCCLVVSVGQESEHDSAGVSASVSLMRQQSRS